MTFSTASEHGSRIDVDRRERMRQRLLESAMRTFATRGAAVSAIQEVITHAEISQATFYKHFRTNEELLLAVSQELNDELIALIEFNAGNFVDPAKRIATGVRHYLHTALDCPMFARFMVAAGMRVLGPNSLLFKYLPEHITRGEQTGRFVPMPLDLAIDLVAGTTLAGVARVAAGTAPANYPEFMAAAVLRGLGVPPGQADRLVRIELPAIEPTQDGHPHP